MGAMYDAGSPAKVREIFGKIAPMKHYDINIRHMQRKKSMRTISRRFGHTFSQFIHGKFGIDTIFLAFGFFGALVIPYYFYNKMQVRRKIARLSDIDPEIIENLTEDDPNIDLDDVSYHVCFYDMREAREEKRKEREREMVRDELIKDVYEKGRYKVVSKLEDRLSERIQKYQLLDNEGDNNQTQDN